MTDITDQDLCKALAWAEGSMARGGADAAARYILATVEAPAPTIAEEIMRLPDYTMSGDHCLNDCYDQAKDLAARAEQIEQERDQARSEAKAWEERFRAAKDDSSELAYDLDDMEQRALKAEAEVERLKDAWEELDKQRIDEVKRLTAERADRPADTLPDPAEVKPGETWIVDTERYGRAVAFRSEDGTGLPWRFASEISTGRLLDCAITLVSRLVPAPRQITTREELYELPRLTVIRDDDGVTCERDNIGPGWSTAHGASTDQRPYITLPATVLWEPEAGHR